MMTSRSFTSSEESSENLNKSRVGTNDVPLFNQASVPNEIACDEPPGTTVPDKNNALDDSGFEVVALPTPTSTERNDESKDRTMYSTRHRQVLSWLLALLVLCVLAWVVVFTVLATHTDVARKHIVPWFETRYFPRRPQKGAGARVFTYLGVFYILAGVGSLFLMCMGAKLPKPNCWMVSRPFIRIVPGWNVLELTGMAVFVAVQVAAIISRVLNKFNTEWWDAEQVWYEASKTLGKTAALTLALLFLPVSKSCFWWDITNCKFERAIKYHRVLAWFLVWVVVAHAGIAIRSLHMVGQFRNCMWPSEDCEKPGGWGTYQSLMTSRVLTFGWLSALILIPLAITSFPWFRRHRFEWFYYTHFLFVPFIVLVHLHFAKMIYYTAPGLAAYVMDKVLWWACSRRATQIVSLTNPVKGFVRMEIALESINKFEPGQWVQFKVPAISILQWHPMSVASSPGHSTIAIDIKVMGDWTHSLLELCERFDPNNSVHTCIFLDEFHGSSHCQMQGYLNHGAVLMFAGGIGITPMMSALRTLVEDESNFSHISRVKLVWVVKKESVVELYRAELAKMSRQTGRRCQLDIVVHATLSEKEDEVVLSSTLKANSTPSVATEARASHAPFMKYLMGYPHKLILTLGAGGGYLLGIFVANVFALDKGWTDEYVAMLQLVLAVLCAGTLVATGLSGSFFRASPALPDESARKTVNMFHSMTMTSDDEESNLRAGECGLNVVLGCRPDVQDIVKEMKDWCSEKKCPSVGVSVCGPDNLVNSVTKKCKEASSSSVQFVVDDETFEW